MKARWEKKQIGEIAQVKGGKRVPKGYKLLNEPTPHPYITVSDFADNGTIDRSNLKYISNEIYQGIKQYTISSKDLYLSIAGTIGKTGSVPDDLDGANLTENACKLVFNSGIDRDYIYYFTQSDDFAIQARTNTRIAAQAKLALERLKTITLAIPPFPEQQRIVGILGEAFDANTTAKTNAEKNLKNARALFESHLQSVFTKRGEGWVKKRLGDKSLLEIIDGDRGVNYPKSTDFYDEGHCLFLNTKNVRPDGFAFESTMFITPEKDGQLRKGKLKQDDVVLTTRGTIGNVGLYSEDVPFDNIRINSGMLIFRPNKRSLLPSFLFELLRSEIVKEQIRKQTTGEAQPQLPIKTLINFTIPVPTDLEEQRALVTKIHAFEPEAQRLEAIYQQKLAALDELKKSLLHQAFRGQL
jgi:restriction endonuclease S subunit